VASYVVPTEGTAVFGAYQGTAWALFFKRVVLVAGLLATLGTVEHLGRHHPRRQGEYYQLLLLSMLGMMLLPGVRDLLLLFVCFELMGIPLYVLASYAKTDAPGERARRGPEAGLKLYLVGVASTAITLFGLSLVFGMTGTTSIDALGTAPAAPLLVLGILMMLAGMSFKIGVVPFHMWVPDTYEGAPTPFVSFLSVAPKLAGFAALAAVFLDGFAVHVQLWQPVVVALSLVTMVVGNLIALAQSNIKRLLAYSGIAHIGYMLMAFATASPYGAGMLLFYVAAYVLTNVGAFLVVEAVASAGGDDSLRSFDGLARRAPYLAMAMLLFLLSLAGIPFVVGFWAKLYVFMAAWRSGLELLVIVGAVLAVLALFYYMRVARAMYMNEPGDLPTPRPGFGLELAVTLCLAGVVLLGLRPGGLVDLALRSARPFFG
jgi:NADH-quinone oxidoreductase subunit N